MFLRKLYIYYFEVEMRGGWMKMTFFSILIGEHIPHHMDNLGNMDAQIHLEDNETLMHHQIHINSKIIFLQHTQIVDGNKILIVR